MNSLKNVCINCNKFGHQIKYCDEPIISYGIICFTISPLFNIYNKHIENYFYNKFLDIGEYNYDNINNIIMIPKFYDMIKILLVRRKHSLNYIEFIRGKWESNIESVKSKFILMTKDELYQIKTTSFENLWSDLWKETAQSKIYMKEYNMAKLKFNELVQNDFYNLLDSTMTITQYTEPEWGFPKGRKNNMECNLNCAIREFMEETNIEINNMHILERLNPMEESFIGTNNKNYKHVYYLANSEEEIELDVSSNYQTNEIGSIKWFTIPEALNLMRSYNDKRIQLIHQFYFFIINMIMNINPNYQHYIEQ